MSSIQIPKINRNIDTADVVAPIANPAISSPTGSASIDPDVVARLESVGLPIFGNSGGIVSLLHNNKPKQMVA